MTPSPIILGGESMLPHGLGAASYNGWNYTSVGNATGRVNLLNLAITVKQAGSPWLMGTVNVTLWTGTAASVIAGAVSIDSGGVSQWGRLYLNQTSCWYQFSYRWWAQTTPGAHTVNLGVQVLAGSFNASGNEASMTALVVEMGAPA